jgi:hypothetical protein
MDKYFFGRILNETNCSEDHNLLGCNTVRYGKWVPTFLMNMPPAEDGGSISLQNISICLQNYAVTHAVRISVLMLSVMTYNFAKATNC